jgi:tetratricopeptide (TPR) repeat protein
VSVSLFEQYKAALRRGHLAAVGGDLEGALDAYRAAAALVPDRALPLSSQGTVLHRLDRWPEAAEAFDMALQLAPDNEAALRARAMARAERGRDSGAATDFERLAFVLDVASRSAEAADAARRAADLEPSPSRQALVDRLAAVAANTAGLGGPASATPLADQLPSEDDAGTGPDPLDDESAESIAASLGAWADLAPESATDVEPGAPAGSASAALAARIAELGTQPGWVDLSGRQAGIEGGVDADGRPWPAIDLPSPPPAPLEGPPPDPETLLAEAAALVDAGDIPGAADRILTAVIVHRAAGRLDAALEACLQLLTIAPGDPQAHLAIANLQLDYGWTELATEKIELLLRLTSLTGDTQAEADAHGLAAERLRDNAVSTPATR